MTSLPYAVQRVKEHYPAHESAEIESELRYSTFVNLERGYLYFEVPKAACSTMKTLIHKIESLPPIKPFVGKNRELRRDMFIHERGLFKMPSLMDFDNATQKVILESDDIFRFTIVRNPYTRISSAWRDKVRLCAPGYEYIYQHFNKSFPSKNHIDSLLSFHEFLSYISNENLDKANHHWRRQRSHLFFEAMNFSHVGKLENLEATITKFLLKIDVTSETAHHSVNEAGGWTNYDEEAADQVYSLFRSDFSTFQYEQDSWRSLARQEPKTTSTARFIDEIVERNITIGCLYEIRENLYEKLRIKENDTFDSTQQYSFDDIYTSFISQVFGWISKAELETLFELSAAIENGCIVEIGSYRGRSTAALAFGSLAGAKVPVFAIEPHDFFVGDQGGEFNPRDRAYFMRTMLELGLFHIVRLINLKSEQLGSSWPLPVSLLWIDGDHSYEAVSKDFCHWQQSLSSGAIVVLNDARDSRTGPGRITKELETSGEFIRIKTSGNMVVLKKVKQN